MTVAISVTTADGLVLAADSRTTFGAAGGPRRVLSDYTHKVFKVGDHGVATYGWAVLNGRNVAAHVARFARRIEEEGLGVDDLTMRFADHFNAEIESHITAGHDARPPAGVFPLGFLVVGYDTEGLGHSKEVLLPGGEIRENHTTDSAGAAWRGQTDVIRRIIKGVDLDLLLAHARSQGLDSHTDALTEIMAGMEYGIPFARLNLQDAIDFASFAIRVTADTQRFIYGTFANPGSWPGVGGPVEIGVDDGTGFRFLRETKLRYHSADDGQAEFS